MPLTDAQKGFNKKELESYFKQRSFEIKSTNNESIETVKEKILQTVLNVCDEFDLMLNIQNKAMECLLQLLEQLPGSQEKLKQWVFSYKNEEKTASEQARQLHADQPFGIVRSLFNNTNANVSEVWCEDFDLNTCLKDLMVDPQDICRPGTYILRSILLREKYYQEHLKNTIETLTRGKKFHLRLMPAGHNEIPRLAKNFIVLKKISEHIVAFKNNEQEQEQVDLSLILSEQDKALLDFSKDTTINYDQQVDLCNRIAAHLGYTLRVPGLITLLIPVNDGGHWRLASVTIKDYVVTAAKLWDSMSSLSEYNPVYMNLQEVLPHIDVAREASGIQKNGWSCGDFVIQKSLQELPASEYPKLGSEGITCDPKLLRGRVVNRILLNCPGLWPEKSNVAIPVNPTSPKGATNATFETIFDEAINKALGFKNSPTHSNVQHKEEFVVSLQQLASEARSSFYVGDLSWDDAEILATSAQELAVAVSLCEAVKIQKSIQNFVTKTDRLKTTWGWRMVLGAVIGAAIGILLGVMVGIAAGPAAAFTALALGVKGAVVGASFFGVGGLLTVGGLGLWGDRRAGEQEPLIAKATDVANKSQQCLPKPTA